MTNEQLDTLTEMYGHDDLAANSADVVYNLLAHFENFMRDRPAQNEEELATKVLARFEPDGHATNCLLFENLTTDAHSAAGMAAHYDTAVGPLFRPWGRVRGRSIRIPNIQHHGSGTPVFHVTPPSHTPPH